MKTFTVVLLYPDFMASNYGQDIYIAAVTAVDVRTAIAAAQQEAAEEQQHLDPEDFACVVAFHGDCEIALVGEEL